MNKSKRIDERATEIWLSHGLLKSLVLPVGASEFESWHELPANTVMERSGVKICDGRY